MDRTLIFYSKPSHVGYTIYKDGKKLEKNDCRDTTFKQGIASLKDLGKVMHTSKLRTTKMGKKVKAPRRKKQAAKKRKSHLQKQKRRNRKLNAAKTHKQRGGFWNPKQAEGVLSKFGPLMQMNPMMMPLFLATALRATSNKFKKV